MPDGRKEEPGGWNRIVLEVDNLPSRVEALKKEGGRPPVLPFVLAAMLGADPAAIDTWPGFRGDGSSHSAARDLPVTWSPKDNLAWRIVLPGYGQSSPVVWRDRIFVTVVEGRDKAKCIVVAADLQTGKSF
jgi:hypothetical protein